MIKENKDRPVTIAVNPALQEELKIRQKDLLNATGRRTAGGLTTISELVAMELEMLRMSSEDVIEKINALSSKNKLKHFDNIEYVPYYLYKKLFIYTSILNKKKDTNQIVLNIFKPRGSKKHVVKILR